MKDSFVKKFGSDTGKLHWFHWLVIALSLLLTFGAWHFSKTQIEEKNQFSFERQADQMIELVKERMGRYEEALWAGVGAIQSQSHGMSHSEWVRFSDALKIHKRYPGINGIGTINYVPPEELKSFLANERKDRPDFKIHPEHEQGEYWPITFIEPVAINAAAVGLDMAHEANRFTAAKKARDTGTAQITGPITLVQDAAKTPGFLFYVPHYKDGEYKSEEARHKNFVGLVYAPFIFSKLMEGTLGEENRQLGVNISDSGDVLYDEHSNHLDDYDPDPLYSKTSTVNFYGRDWVFDIRAAKSFRAATENNQPAIILTGGLIIDSLLIGLFLLLSKSNQRAVNLAHGMTKDLVESEEKLSNVFETAVDGLITINDRGIVESYNPACEKIFGYSAKEVVGKNIKMLMPEPYKKEHDGYLKNYTNTGEKKIIGIGREVEGRKKDGSVFPMELSISEMDINGKKLFNGIIRDITERVEAQQKIKDSEEFLSLMMANDPDAIFVKDKGFRIIKANQAFLNFYPEDQRDRVIGYTGFESYRPEEVEEFVAMDKIAFEKGSSETLETILFPDGETRTLFTQKIRFENSKGEEFILGLARDVTEREELIRQLTASNQELDDFAYIASHDLKEPIRGISNFANFIARDYNDLLDDDGKRKLERINILTKYMKKLVEDLLFYSRLGRSELAVQEVDLNDVVTEVQEMILASSDGDIEIKNSAKLPTINCDSVKIIELFRNLLSNAIKYNDSEKKVVEVGMKTAKDGADSNVLYVKDNGIGIEEKFHDEVFRIFQRLHRREEYGGGTGSGLTFVKKIIERHNGKIWIESKKGEGTTFFFTLSEEK